jgi:putative membrane protein
MLVRHLLVLAGGGLLMAAVPLSSTQAQAKPATKADSVQADSRLIHEATADNLLEVRLGELAERKATNAMVKQFAQRMVTDHQRMEKQWTDMASKHGMPFQPGLGKLHEQKVDRLQRADQQTFDREYVTTVIRQHVDDVDYFKNEGESARSAPVRNLVAYMLPILQDHLTSARQVGKQVGVDSAVVARNRHSAHR